MRATISSSRVQSTQSLADELQQLIADVMAKGIVNAFELIEIETENRQAFTALDRLIS